MNGGLKEPPGAFTTSQFHKNMVLWVLILLMTLMLLTMLRVGATPSVETSYSEFVSHLDAGEIESVVIDGNHISVRMKRSDEFTTYAPAITDGLLSAFKEKKVPVVARPSQESPLWQTVLIYWFPFLLFMALWLFFLRGISRRR